MDKGDITFAIEQESGGRGAWFLGRFLYLKLPLRRGLIAMRRGQEKVEKILAFIAWIFIFAGWLAFIIWLYLNYQEIIDNPFRLLTFWAKYHPLLLVFFFSLWFDLLVVYKRSEDRAKKKKINHRLFISDEEKKEKKTRRLGPKRYNVGQAFSDSTLRSLEDAYLLARRLKQANLEIIHLFRVLLKDRDIQNLFVRLNVDAKKLVEMVDRRLVRPQDEPGVRRPEISTQLQEVLILSFVDACWRRRPSIDALNIILFFCEADPVLAEILYELEIDKDKIINTVEWFRVNERLLESYHNYRRLAILKPGTGMNRAYTAIATPSLDHYSRDLTVKAKLGDLDICVGRQKEITSIFESFIGGHNGVLLVGPNGVGKSAIIDGLAQLMVEERVPEFLKDKRLVQLDVSGIVAGGSAAEAEGRLLDCLNEISRSGNIILYIDNIENLIGISAGSRESLDLSEVLAEALSHRSLFCLGAASAENYARYIEGKNLGEVMTTIGIKEPGNNEAIQILESKVGFLENKYDVYIVYSAIEQAVSLSQKYLHEQFLPLKAFNLLEKAALIAAKKAKNNPEQCFCSKDEVAEAISEMTGILASKVTASESQKLLNLEKEIHGRLVDQEEAVSAVAASLRRARAELKDSKRPIASFLFMGPTGVGKTELAKAVSQVYFGDENYLIRLDMSEYQYPDSIRKMIGDVDGTLGYLTEAVRKKPFALVLFDEIEKAHPDILNLFLQMMDDGRLTDGQGRTISFSESIIIATSNIGAVYISEQIRAKTAMNIIKQHLIDNELNKYLRPELINRFDGVIVFKPLSQEDVFSIASLMLRKIKKSLADKGIGLKADREGVAILAQQGYDPKFGARPLRRLLQEKVEDPIANLLLGGDLKRRDTVLIDSRAAISVEKAAEL